MRNRQIGPEAPTDVLAGLVSQVSYKDGWGFELREVDREQGSEGLTLCISAPVKDSYSDTIINILHYMPVPPAGYDERTWKRWIVDQVILVETHEALEFFRINDEVVFPPNHGPGRNPYSILEVQSAGDAATPAMVTHGRGMSARFDNA